MYAQQYLELPEPTDAISTFSKNLALTKTTMPPCISNCHPTFAHGAPPRKTLLPSVFNRMGAATEANV
jgi:hypothetical protein